MQRPHRLQWCARSGLWLSHFEHMRLQPLGCVGRLVRGVAPGLLSMARACEARDRLARKLKARPCSHAPSVLPHHPASTVKVTAKEQYSTMTHVRPAQISPQGSVLSQRRWLSRVPQPRLRDRSLEGREE